MPILDTIGIPRAERIEVAMCADERCGKLHIVMLDENLVPIAVGAIEDLNEHIEDLKRMAYKAATRRPG